MKEMKSFQVRLDADLHKFFKIYAVNHDSDMNSILIDFLRKLREREEKVLTNNHINDIIISSL